MHSRFFCSERGEKSPCREIFFSRFFQKPCQSVEKNTAICYIIRMDIDVLIKQASDGNMLGEVGKEFFADKSRTSEQTRKFITALLEKKAYENLATVMSFGCIDNAGGGSYLADRNRRTRLSDRYFDNFMELCKSCGVDMSLVYPMLFAAFDAPKSGYLYSFVGGIDAYFMRYTSNDYDAAAEIIRKYDKKYKCLSTLMAADKTRTVSNILNDLIYGKSANKTILRKYILEKRVDIVPSLCREYLKAKAKQKEGIVRLLLLYKGDPRAERFLEEIERSEKSVSVLRLIEHYKNARHGTKERAEEEILGSVEKDGIVYTLIPESDLTVKIVPSPYPKEAEIAAEKAEKRLREISADLEKSMENNTRKPCDYFIKRIAEDRLFAAVASSLLFSVYKFGTLSDIVTVENGEIRDLDNKKCKLEDAEVAVSHPIEWEYFEFLKGINAAQPFEQIKRATFVASDSEKMYNFCGRVRGVIMSAGEFKSALGKKGFKMLNKNRYNESSCAAKVRNDIVCVLEFSPTDFSQPHKTVSMGDVRFYRYADLIKLGGQTYTDGIKPYPVAAVDAVMFSEFLRDVFGALNL